MSEQPTPADLTAAAEAFLREWARPYFGEDQNDAVAAVMRAARAAGFGPVRAVEAELSHRSDMVLHQQRRAEQAEAREKALRESVEAAERRMRREGSDHAAGILRALLATSPDREDGAS